MADGKRASPTQRVYQPLPDLPDGEFDVLKADIAEHGVQYPVIQDETGNTLDGHQRERAVRELGIRNYPVKVISGLTDEEKWTFALSVNVKRRHLSSAQKRMLIEQELRRAPDRANNWLAELLGVDKNTVAAVRKRLEGTCEIPRLGKLRGKDGKQRPSEIRQVLANTRAELRTARDVVTRLPPSSSGRVLDTTSAARWARRHTTATAREAERAAPAGDDSSIGIHHCRFQDLCRVAKIKRGSVDLIVTDIPYGRDFLPEVEDLGTFAADVLTDGGALLMLCGQYHLDLYMAALGRHLTYRWTLATSWDARDATVIHPLAVTNCWKPILWYTRGKQGGPANRRCDLVHHPAKEKASHEWQQPVGDFEYLVKCFTVSGALVVDPCAGTFSTAVACRNLGRRFVGCDVDAECIAVGRRRLSEGAGRTG